MLQGFKIQRYIWYYKVLFFRHTFEHADKHLTYDMARSRRSNDTIIYSPACVLNVVTSAPGYKHVSPCQISQSSLSFSDKALS